MAYHDDWEYAGFDPGWSSELESTLGQDQEFRALFIGKDPAMARTYQLKLELDGYRTSLGVIDGDGKPVYDLPAPDIIYLDLTTSPNWGLQALRAIREDSPTKMTPVLLLVDDPAAVTAPLGPNDFLIHHRPTGHFESRQFAAPTPSDSATALRGPRPALR
jgi:CheY-like chemotaxis protein